METGFIRSYVNTDAFERMKSREQKIDFRLRRAKWEEVRAGDVVQFTYEDDRQRWLRVRVCAVLNYPTFEALLMDLEPQIRHYTGKYFREQLEDLVKEYGDPSKGYYTQAEEEKYSVLGLLIEPLEVHDDNN